MKPTLLELYTQHHHMTHIEVRMAIEEQQRQIDRAIQALEQKAYGVAAAILKFGLPPANEPALVLAGPTRTEP